LLFQQRQSADITKQKGLSELKATLKDIVQNLAAAGSSKQFLLYTTSYLVSLDPSTGLHWGKMTQEQASSSPATSKQQRLKPSTLNYSRRVG